MKSEFTTAGCSLCGQPKAREVRRTQIVGKGDEIVIAPNVPMISCSNCGHDYFSLAVARQLNQIRAKSEACTTRKSFAVAELV